LGRNAALTKKKEENSPKEDNLRMKSYEFLLTAFLFHIEITLDKEKVAKRLQFLRRVQMANSLISREA
jgi:hypothetical protein